MLINNHPYYLFLFNWRKTSLCFLVSCNIYLRKSVKTSILWLSKALLIFSFLLGSWCCFSHWVEFDILDQDYILSHFPSNFYLFISFYPFWRKMKSFGHLQRYIVQNSAEWLIWIFISYFVDWILITNLFENYCCFCFSKKVSLTIFYQQMLMVTWFIFLFLILYFNLLFKDLIFTSDPLAWIWNMDYFQFHFNHLSWT